MTNGQLGERGTRPLTEEQQQLLALTFAIQRAGTYEAFLRQLADCSGAAIEASEFIQAQQTALRNWLVQELVLKPLTDDSKWVRLAHRPKAFTESLESLLNRFSRFFKQSYGITSHRPTTELARDRKIWEMRHSGKTFGQIAQHLDISSRVAERAFKRRETALQKQTEQILDMLRDALTQTGFPFNKALPSNRVM